MAIGHIAVRAHSRANGHSAAAALAYRFGEALTCSRTGERHDFSRRSQREDISACGLSTGPFRTAGALATAIENAERRKNSRLLRDVQIALPAELDDAARTALTERFAGELAARYGTVTAWAVHRPDRRSDARNHHAHIVLPTRSLDEHGKLGKKIRKLDDRKNGPKEIEAIRALWETQANEALHTAGLDSRVHTGRTTDPEPTLGATHTAIERRAWSTRHRGQTPPAMSAARLVLDDGQCATGRGRRLARHGTRRAFLDHTLGRHAPRSVPVPEAAPAPVTALEPIPDMRPDPEARAEPLRLPTAPVTALEPIPDMRPDPEARAEPLRLPTAPVTALEPIPDMRPDPEARAEPLRLPTAPVTALEPIPDMRPDPEPRPALLRLPTAPVTALEPIPDMRPDPEARAEPLRLPTAPVTALEPIPDVRSDPEARPALLLLTKTLDAVERWTGVRALHRLDLAIRLARGQRTHMTQTPNEIDRARRRRGPAVQAHADTHGQAPTRAEIAEARGRLERHFGDRADEITKLRFYPRTEAPPIQRSTAERLRGEIHWHDGKSYPTGCQTAEGAATAAKPLDQALDQIAQRNLNGALHPHEYRRGVFGLSLENACKAARAEWSGIRERVIEKMLQAATSIEAIAERQRLQRLRKERAKRQADAEAKRRKMAAVSVHTPQLDPERSRWD